LNTYFCVESIQKRLITNEKERETRGVSHCGLAIYIKKYLKAKEDLWKLKYFTMQKYNLQKILLTKPKSFRTL
jgi:hypothetical protein